MQQVPDYEALRQANIQKNLEKLRQLGISSSNSSTINANGGTAKETKQKQKRKRERERKEAVIERGQAQQQQQQGEGEGNEVPMSGIRRRSPRIQGKEAIDYGSLPMHDDGDDGDVIHAAEGGAISVGARARGNRKGEQRQRTQPQSKNPGEILSIQSKTQNSRGVADEKPPTKEVHLPLAKLSSEWVGKIFQPPEGDNSMKAYVMNTIAEKPIRFSKYSGIQWFANAIVLFVNVGGDSSYENMFFVTGENTVVNNEATKSDSDRRCRDGDLNMTWFAQSRQKEDTPVIQEIVRPNANIFLFLRFTGDAYVCCGPVKVKDANYHRSPMKFTWKIEKYHYLWEHSELFRELVGEPQAETEPKTETETEPPGT